MMKKVLLIEDDDEIANVLAHFLNDEGLKTLRAEDGESGLEKVRSERPDLIILDIILPIMDGFEVCRILKADEELKSIPIIMMTGVGDKKNTVKCLSAGADDYVPKPCNFPELMARVKSHLRMKDLYDSVKSEGEEKSKASGQILEMICQAQSQFIVDLNRNRPFDGLVKKFLSLTRSEYGLIAELLHNADGTPYLKNHASAQNISNEEISQFFEKNPCEGFKFKNMKTLLGSVVASRKPVISNDPMTDPRQGGALPQGHPPISSFLGLPLYKVEELIGIIAVANRPGGYSEEMLEYLKPYLITCANIMSAYQNDRRRKEADKSLKESEEKFRLLYENIPIPYQSLDENGHFIEVNRAFLDKLGYSREEIIGKWFGDLIAPQYLEFFKGNFPQFKESGEINGVEFELKRKGSSLISVLYTGRIGYDMHGKFKQTHCVWEDITPRKQTEEALGKKTAFIDSILRSSVDMAIAATDLDFRITYYNSMAEKIYGYRAEEVIGRTVVEMHTKEKMEPSRFERAIKIVREKGEYRYMVEQKKEDGTYYIESRVSGILGKEGELIGFLLMSQDITQRKMAEEELRERTERLEKFQKLTVGRELDMVKLKREVNALLEELGKPEKYEEVDKIPNDED